MTQFKPTHKVVKAEEGLFVYAVGALLQAIGNGYYKGEYGHIKFVEDVYLEKLA